MTTLKNELPTEVINFGKLHDDFRIHPAPTKVILGIKSNTTLWRRRKEEGFPKPDRFNTYRVGDIRTYLASLKSK